MSSTERTIPVGEIAEKVGGKLIGKADAAIHGPADLAEARAGEISFLANPKYRKFLMTTRASAVVLGPDDVVEDGDFCQIVTDNPNLAFAKVIDLFASQTPDLPEGIHPQALVAEGVSLGKDVRVGPFAVVSSGASVGEGTQIHAGVFLGQDVQVGSNCVFFPNAVVRENVVIGDRVRVGAGTVIGSEGFGYDLVDGKWQTVPQCGRVIIEDDVHMGAACTVDRARFGATRVERGAKFDNLVHVAHNVIIGHDSLLIAQTGISGSARLGHHVIIAGQSGVDGHISIGDGSRVAGGSGVTSDLPPGSEVGGYPAVPFKDFVRSMKRLRQADDTFKTIRELTQRIEDLEKKLGDRE